MSCDKMKMNRRIEKSWRENKEKLKKKDLYWMNIICDEKNLFTSICSKDRQFFHQINKRNFIFHAQQNTNVDGARKKMRFQSKWREKFGKHVFPSVSMLPVSHVIFTWWKISCREIFDRKISYKYFGSEIILYFFLSRLCSTFRVCLAKIHRTRNRCFETRWAKMKQEQNKNNHNKHENMVIFQFLTYIYRINEVVRRHSLLWSQFFRSSRVLHLCKMNFLCSTFRLLFNCKSVATINL